MCDTVIENRLVWRRTTQAGLIILSLVLSVHGLFDPPSNEQGMWEWLLHPYDNPTEQVYHYVLNHSHQVICPMNPLITLLADGELYHNEMGVFDRLSANQPPSVRQLVDHFPTDLKELVYGFHPQSRMIETIVLKFHTRVQEPEIPDAIVLTP